MPIVDHLVGRAAEVGRLDAALERLDERRLVAVELVGEPGIGKSRLLAELGHRAEERGHLVLSGRASELERDLPFWVFVDALDDYVAGLGPRSLHGLEDDERAVLARVLPALAGEADEPGVALQDERYRTHRALCSLLERLAATEPLVLVLDDLHWADAASADLVGALLRRPPAAAVLLALAVRPRQLPERLSAALEGADRAGTLTRMDLDALAPGEAEELLGGDVAGPAAAALYAETGGNPFYLEQLARSVDGAGAARAPVPAVSVAGVQVPHAVVAALTEELGLLSPGGRRVLEGASVAGDPFEPELAAAAAELPEPTAVDALDELLALDLVRPTDVPRRFRFRHPLVRRAVYEATSGGWRLGAHERTAAALAARGASAATRAHHVERSARHGDAGAVAVLREAGATAAQLAPASAARWYAGALRLLPETTPAAERVELLLAHAGALAAAGRFADGHAAMREALALVPADSVDLRVRLTGGCAAIEHLLGHHDEANTRLTRALRDLPDQTSPGAVALMVELTLDGFYGARYGAMVEWSATALDTARALGDRPLLAAAMSIRTLACAFTGAAAEGLRHRDEAAALVEDLTDAELALRLDAAANLAGAELYLDRFEDARAHAERAIAVGRATAQTELFPVMVVTLGSVLCLQGHLAESGELLDAAVEGARLTGNAQLLAWNLLNRALVADVAGDLGVALTAGEESFALAGGLEESLVSAWTGANFAAPLLASGDAARAADVLVGSCGGPELPLIPGGWRAFALELLTRCHLALGDRVAAERAAAEAAACSGAVGLPLASSLADRAAAAVALAAGDDVRAAETALAAAATADAAGMPVEAARARLLAGRALARADERDRAITELVRAAETFDRVEATRLRDEAERELRATGHRLHRRSRAIPAGSALGTLTAREQEIARLVVDRRTNAEIAAELFLSPKTIETHLRNTFLKLGVSSRVELARAVERADRDRAGP
jgi:DNA-binding NarL/FixJ family response regulator